MRDHDFQALVDQELTSLQWTDAQRLNTLRLMHQPERKPMKKTFVLALTVVLLLASTLTAFAAGANLPTIQDFIARLIPGDPYHDRVNVPVDAQAIVTPANLRHTSQLADVEITQVYLHDGKLYIISRITPKDVNTIIYTESALPVIMGGQEMHYFDLYKQDDLTLLEFVGFDINPHEGSTGYQSHYDMSFLYNEGEIDPESKTLTLLTVYEWQENLLPLGTQFTMQAGFIVENSRTNAWEWNILFADMPELVPVTTEQAE